MTRLIGVICSHCGVHHNDLAHHKCLTKNITYARKQLVRFLLRRQDRRCIYCARRLSRAYTTQQPRESGYELIINAQTNLATSLACHDCWIANKHDVDLSKSVM